MSKLLFAFAAFAAAFALLRRHYQHVTSFRRLTALALVTLVLAVLSLSRHPVTNFLEAIRRLAD